MTFLNNKKPGYQLGFTLLEIMIALAIFAVSSAVLIKNATQSVRQTGIIQEKTLAYWVAENHINQMRALPREEDNFPTTGIKRSSVIVADREWEVVVNVEATENEDMRSIEVSVFNPDDLDHSLVTLSGFVGKY